MLNVCQYSSVFIILPLNSIIIDESYQVRALTIKSILVINVKNTKSIMTKHFYWDYLSFRPNPSPPIHALRDYR